MEKLNWERTAAAIFCVLVGVAGAYVLLKFAMGVFLPFIIGCALGTAVRRPALAMQRKSGISDKVWGILLLSAVLIAACVLLFFAAERLVGELGRLTESLASDGDGFASTIEDIEDYLNNLTARLPIIRDVRASSGNEEFWERMDLAMSESVSGMLKELGASVPKVAGEVVSALPRTFLFLSVAIISGFFFASGGVSFKSIVRPLPEGLAKKAERLKCRACAALSSWFRAYMLILGLTFVELFIGFSVLGVNYSFIAAACVALVDILPIFGVGAVLVPWGAVSILTGDGFRGVGLLVIWAVVSVVRQFAEPRIVGKSLGVPPLLTFFAMYAGLCLFGIGGMIVAPAVIILVRAFVEEGRDRTEVIKKE